MTALQSADALKAFLKWLMVVCGAALAAWTMFAGCAKSPPEEDSLENVNKNWNRLIRASHIFPVYPLSQDLQPGDVFLTRKHIEDTSEWNEPGYLPFDHHLTRLYPTGYVSFYTNSFGVGAKAPLPRDWIETDKWKNAPAAAFPTYSFKIKQGGSGSVSLPIQGVPVGLSLMGAREASGMVTIADSHTYGVDELSLRKQVLGYLERHGEEMFKYIGAEVAGSNGFFLQVVSRVYTTSRVAVSMFNEGATGGGISAGIAPQTSIPLLTNATDFYIGHESRKAMFSIDTKRAYETLRGVTNYVNQLKSPEERELYSNALKNLDDIRVENPAPGTIGQERDRAVQQLRHVVNLPLPAPAKSELTNAIGELNSLPTFRPQAQIGPLPNDRARRKY